MRLNTKNNSMSRCVVVHLNFFAKFCGSKIPFFLLDSKASIPSSIVPFWYGISFEWRWHYDSILSRRHVLYQFINTQSHIDNHTCNAYQNVRNNENYYLCPREQRFAKWVWKWHLANIQPFISQLAYLIAARQSKSNSAATALCTSRNQSESSHRFC